MFHKTTEEMKVEMRAIGAQALRDNKDKTRDMMRDHNGRCCLCVMQDAVNKQYDMHWWGDDHHPNLRAMEEYGFTEANPSLPCPVKGIGPVYITRVKAAHLNDGDLVDVPVDGLPHTLIAECLENFGKKNMVFSFFIQLNTHENKPVKATLVECEPYHITV